ncbi:MAG: hypothetical protein IJ456_05210 [Bacteroides sp.]|nr:hypothetical protein [Bacteroides sp.]
MKRQFLLLITLCISLSVLAQGKKCSKEEFQERKRAYMTEKASLTPEEADRFFPLYFELQEKKRQINGRAWHYAKEKEATATDAEYEKIVDGFADAQIQSCTLDKEYQEKYKAFLSPKKIYQLYRAEIKFHRNMLKIMQRPDKKK